MGRFLDLKGKRFGKLTALHRIEDGEKGYAKWLCKCDCGGEIIVNTKHLMRGTVTNCGCNPKKTAGNGTIAENLKGQKFGMLLVIKRAENRNGRVAWLCRCDCGNEKICTAKQLKSGEVKSCGCRNKMKNINYKDISGQRFGRLIALYPTDMRDKKGSVKWKCRCDCGKDCMVTEDALVGGNTRSCGCRKEELQAEVYKKVSLYEGTSYTILKTRKKPRVDNRSGHRGIALRPNGKYRVHIGFKGKNYILGTYDNLQEALEIRKYAEETLHEGFCEAFERWKHLSHDDKDREEKNPLIFDVRFKDKEFHITCNIKELEERYSVSRGVENEAEDK